MQTENTHRKAREWFILLGGCLFILVPGISALWGRRTSAGCPFSGVDVPCYDRTEPSRESPGFVGLSAADLWDYANILATSFVFNGFEELGQWIHTGRLARPDLLIAVPAWFSNFFVVIGCLWA
jgi:hypothetical protein